MEGDSGLVWRAWRWRENANLSAEHSNGTNFFERKNTYLEKINLICCVLDSVYGILRRALARRDDEDWDEANAGPAENSQCIRNADIVRCGNRRTNATNKSAAHNGIIMVDMQAGVADFSSNGMRLYCM